MVSIRKRRHDDRVAASEPPSRQPEPPSMLLRLRNMWQFACLCQWFYIFGSAVKLDNLDIDELEAQCLSPHSTALQDIGLALLKFLSSHRGLTNDLFDEYTRRQYVSKAPELPNPFGTDEVPAKFTNFTVFQRIRILHQMTLFIMMNPEKLREKMVEQKDADNDQTAWRIEPFGWDRDDRIYYVLDDNRVYRLTETPPAPPKPKRNTKKARAQARRNNKRRRVSSAALDNAAEGNGDDSEMQVNEKQASVEENAEENVEEDIDTGLGGMKWECIAVSLADLHSLLASVPGRKDPNERVLHDKIVEHLLPILEQQEERRKKRERERDKELLNLAKMASAKRSSRIADRQEQQRQDEILREEEQKRRLELDALRKEDLKRRKVERERDNRLLSREKRLHEREVRRAQHEEELAQLSEDSRSLDHATGRMSERQRLAEIQKNKEALRELEEEGEEEWVFDCICGLHGKVDDGQHSVSCERCNIWQHSRCLDINEEEAEKDDFHFICVSCKRRVEDTANGRTRHRPVIKIQVNKPVSGTSLPARQTSEPKLSLISIDIPVTPLPKLASSGPAPLPTQGRSIKADVSQVGAAASDAGVNGSAALQIAVQSTLEPPQAGNVDLSVPVKVDSSTSLLRPVPAGESKLESVSGAGATQNGHPNAFSMPHPGLSRPDQSPRKSHAYGTIYEQRTPAPLAHVLSQPEEHLANLVGYNEPLLALPPSASNGTKNPSADEPNPPAESRRDGVVLGSFTPAPPLSMSNTQLAHIQRTPTSFATPRLHHPREDSHMVNQSEQPSSPLLPALGGLSPTKHSPTVVRDQAGGFSGVSPTLPIIPPAAALSPSAPEQNLTPPVKPEGLAHRQSFSSMATDVVSPPTAET